MRFKNERIFINVHTKLIENQRGIGIEVFRDDEVVYFVSKFTIVDKNKPNHLDVVIDDIKRLYYKFVTDIENQHVQITIRNKSVGKRLRSNDEIDAFILRNKRAGNHFELCDDALKRQNTIEEFI